jgi:protein-S-isoprenylcysteine O-methyltransferase Ste14
MQPPSLSKHLRDLFLLPFNVTIVIPFFIHDLIQVPLTEVVFLKPLGKIILISGLSLFSYTIYLFGTTGKGTLAPWSPTQKLVVKGPYRHCRNPMITGVLFILIGESLLFFSIAILLWAFIFFIINTIYFIIKEEPDLHKRFGEEYKIYKQHVPRWLPRITPYKE